MKIQADITTSLLHSYRGFGVNDKCMDLNEMLRFAHIDCVRVAIFTDQSSLLPTETSIDTIRQLDTDLYLCVHCSDTWADPSHQEIPSKWDFKDIRHLKQRFIHYLTSIFERVKGTGKRIRYIQVGNEISNGMLWPFLTEPYQYIEFIKVAHILSRSFFPQAQIILHTDLSYSEKKALEWYEIMKAQNIDYDLIGLSYYPVWHGPLKQLQKTVALLGQEIGKPVMLCEVGYMNTDEKTSAWFGHWKCDDIPYSPEGQQEYMQHFIHYLQQELHPYLAPEMFYWGMISHLSDEHFPISLFDRNGRALPLLYALNKSL